MKVGSMYGLSRRLTWKKSEYGKEVYLENEIVARFFGKWKANIVNFSELKLFSEENEVQIVVKENMFFLFFNSILFLQITPFYFLMHHGNVRFYMNEYEWVYNCGGERIEVMVDRVRKILEEEN